LPKKYWTLALAHIVYTRNLVLGVNKEKLPYILFFGKTPDYSLIHPFGSHVWGHIPKEKRNKLSPVACKGIYVGVDNVRQGIRVLLPEKQKVVSEYLERGRMWRIPNILKYLVL